MWYCLKWIFLDFNWRKEKIIRMEEKARRDRRKERERKINLMVCVCVVESPKLITASKMASLSIILHWVKSLNSRLQTLKGKFLVKKLNLLHVNIDRIKTGTWSICTDLRGLPGNSVVKNLPAMQEMWVQSLGREDPLEKEMATHFSILVWEIP